MLELFGSDSEDDGDDDEPVVPSAVRAEAEEAEGAENVDEGDLFGSDGEEGEEGQPSSSLPQVPSAAPLEYELPVLRRPPDDAELFLVRMPNILKIQPRPFEADNPESIQDELVQPELDGKKASGGDGEALYEMRSERPAPFPPRPSCPRPAPAPPATSCSRSPWRPFARDGLPPRR